MVLTLSQFFLADIGSQPQEAYTNAAWKYFSVAQEVIRSLPPKSRVGLSGFQKNWESFLKTFEKIDNFLKCFEKIANFLKF